MGGLPPEFSAATDPVELAEAIEGLAKTLPLSGSKTRITKEVEAWATTTDRDLHAPGLLDEYNAEADRAPKQLREALLELARGRNGKPALISLLGRASASDELRLAALDALEPVV